MKEENNLYAFVSCIILCLMDIIFIQQDSYITRHLWGDFTHDFKFVPSKAVSKWLFNLQYQVQDEYIIWAIPNGITQSTDDYRVFEMDITRAATFSLFPRDARVDVDDLICSGFIYSGSEDCVTCHVCGKSYCNWQGDEILSELHTHNCRYRLPNDHSEAEQNHPTHSGVHNGDIASGGDSGDIASSSDSRDIGSGSDRRDITSGQSVFAEHRISETAGQVKVTKSTDNDFGIIQPTTHGDDKEMGILEQNLSSDERNDLRDANDERLLSEVSNTCTSLFPIFVRQNSRHQLLVSGNPTNDTGCHTSSNTDENLSDEVGFLNNQNRMSSTAQNTTSASDQLQLPDFSDIVIRIESFQRGGSSVLDLAMNGFWCNAAGNVIKCFSCGYASENWTEHSDPIEDHQMHQCHCPYLEDLHAGANYLIDYDVLERLPAVYILLLMNYSWDIISVAVDDIVSEGNGISLHRLHADDILNRIFEFTGKEERFFADHVTEEASATILKENEDLKDNFICKICYNRKICILFCPCGHFLCCSECSGAFSKCPMCRKTITSRQHVLFARYKRDK